MRKEKKCLNKTAYLVMSTQVERFLKVQTTDAITTVSGNAFRMLIT